MPISAFLDVNTPHVIYIINKIKICILWRNLGISLIKARQNKMLVANVINPANCSNNTFTVKQPRQNPWL